MNLALRMHGLCHLSEMSGTPEPTLEDEVWEGLGYEDLGKAASRNQGVTIAWNLWHITRIEDLTANILICNSAEVLNNTWLQRLKISRRDTGNAMTVKEIAAFSADMDKQALREYRIAVGRQTEKVLRNLSPEDLKRKPSVEALNRLVPEGCLVEKKQSFWLKDFWSKKTVAGLILLPLIRHQPVYHLIPCLTLKEKLTVKKG